MWKVTFPPRFPAFYRLRRGPQRGDPTWRNPIGRFKLRPFWPTNQNAPIHPIQTKIKSMTKIKSKMAGKFRAKMLTFPYMESASFPYMEVQKPI